MDRDLALLTMVTRQIMANPLEDEMPAARLKQIALMSVIVIEKLHTAPSPITLTQLVDMTGLTRTGTIQSVEPLVQRGLLVESMGRNSMGRGTARQFQLSPAVLRNLAIFTGALVVQP